MVMAGDAREQGLSNSHCGGRGFESHRLHQNWRGSAFGLGANFGDMVDRTHDLEGDEGERSAP